jgi:hypothetical protein
MRRKNDKTIIEKGRRRLKMAVKGARGKNRKISCSP